MATRGRYVSIGVVLALACAAAVLAVVANRLAHRGHGPRHTYPVTGDAVLTDEQAISLARQTLQRDGRFSDKLELVTYGNGSVVNRGDDKSHVSLCWQEAGTNKQWHVELRRAPERVEAVSHPGK